MILPQHRLIVSNTRSTEIHVLQKLSAMTHKTIYISAHTFQRILLQSLLSPYDSYTKYSVSKWTAKLVISYTVYNFAIPWNILISCPLYMPIYHSTATLQLYQWNTHLNTMQVQLLCTLDMAMYNDPLLSNSQTSQTVTVKQSTAFSNDKTKSIKIMRISFYRPRR